MEKRPDNNRFEQQKPVPTMATSAGPFPPRNQAFGSFNASWPIPTPFSHAQQSGQGHHDARIEAATSHGAASGGMPFQRMEYYPTSKAESSSAAAPAPFPVRTAFLASLIFCLACLLRCGDLRFFSSPPPARLILPVCRYFPYLTDDYFLMTQVGLNEMQPTSGGAAVKPIQLMFNSVAWQNRPARIYISGEGVDPDHRCLADLNSFPRYLVLSAQEQLRAEKGSATPSKHKVVHAPDGKDITVFNYNDPSRTAFIHSAFFENPIP